MLPNVTLLIQEYLTQKWPPFKLGVWSYDTLPLNFCPAEKVYVNKRRLFSFSIGKSHSPLKEDLAEDHHHQLIRRESLRPSLRAVVCCLSGLNDRILTMVVSQNPDVPWDNQNLMKNLPHPITKGTPKPLSWKVIGLWSSQPGLSIVFEVHIGSFFLFFFVVFVLGPQSSCLSMNLPSGRPVLTNEQLGLSL